MWRSNKKRDAEYGPADPIKAADNGMAGMDEISNTHLRLLTTRFTGQTEDENIHFRYCY